MDGNSIPFTQFRAFASGGAIDDSTGVPIVFSRFLAGVQIVARESRSPHTRDRRNVSSRRTGDRTAIAIFRDSHGPVAIRCACKLIATVHILRLKVICSLSIPRKTAPGKWGGDGEIAIEKITTIPPPPMRLMAKVASAAGKKVCSRHASCLESILRERWNLDVT